MIAKKKLLSYKPGVRTEWLLREKDVLFMLCHPFIITLCALSRPTHPHPLDYAPTSPTHRPWPTHSSPNTLHAHPPLP